MTTKKGKFNKNSMENKKRERKKNKIRKER